MKSLYIFFSFCIFFYSCKSSEDTISQSKIFKKENNEEEKLLNAIADTHRLLLEQGKLIRDRGTSSPIRDYGQLIVIHETELISKIEALAQIENIKLASQPSPKKLQALTQLTALKEKDFDRKAVREIASQYKKHLEEINHKDVFVTDSNIKALLSYQAEMMQGLSSKAEVLKEEQAEKHFSTRAKYKAWNRGYMVSFILGQFLI